MKESLACDAAGDRVMAAVVQGSMHSQTRCKEPQRVDTCRDDPHIAEQQAFMKGDACAALLVLAGSESS